MGAVISIWGASGALVSAAQADTPATAAQALGALAHTPAAGTAPGLASQVRTDVAQTPSVPVVTAPTQLSATPAIPPSPPAGATPRQSAEHAATQVAGAVHTSGERVAAPATDLAQDAARTDPAAIVPTVSEHSPAGALAGDAQRTTHLTHGLPPIARGVTQVLSTATATADPGHAVVRTLVDGGTVTRALGGGSTVARTLTTLGGGSTVNRTRSGLAARTGAVQRSAGPPAPPRPNTSAAHDGPHPAPGAVAVDGGAEAQREALAAQAHSQTGIYWAGADRAGVQTPARTPPGKARALAQAPFAGATPWRDTELSYDGRSSAPSPAHGAPADGPAPVVPPSPGGVAPATAVGGGGGLALGLGLVALLMVLSAPSVVRRLRLDDESWRRAPLMLIADRPG